MFGSLRVVDRMAASIASLPRLGFDGSMMKRHDDVPGWHGAPGWRQRSDRLAVTIGDPHESLTACRAYASSVPRLGRRMPMKRHDNSQRSSRLAVTQPTTGPRVGAVDRVAALARECSGVRRMRMMRHDDRQHSGRFAVTRPVHHPPPPPPHFSNRQIGDSA